jgi:hypothetical protein
MKRTAYLLFLLLLLAASTGVAQNQNTSQNGGALALSSENRAEVIMQALSLAYPGRVGQAVLRDGDWAVPVFGEWFYYAEGRLLPENLRARAAEYDPRQFYSYPRELPAWKAPDAAQNERLKNITQQRRANPPKPSNHFYDALWGGSTRSEINFHQKTITILGQKMVVHYSILEELALVEERIQIEEKTNAQVRNWVSNLKSASGWNWRAIAETETRSFHSYGVAVDLQGKAQTGLESYWLWTAQKNIDWWSVPYAKRQHPPQAVIKAFEDYGFIWGGKWLLYDTMHFEYRPEILILNGMTVTGAY